MRLFQKMAWVLVLMIWVSPVEAHKSSDSFLSLKIQEGMIAGQWDLALRDLDHAIGLDNNDDGAITWGELRRRHEAIAAYALSRLQIRAQQAECSSQPVDHLVDHHSDGAYAILLFSSECPGELGSLEIGYDLFFDLDPQHRGLMRFQSGNTIHTAIFSPEQKVREIVLGEVDHWRQFLDYVREGIHHIWIGYDHILFLLTLLLPAVLYRRGDQWEAMTRFREVFIDVFKTVTAFTAAHSITLGLSAMDLMDIPSRWTESAIAASVAVVALNNIYPLVTRRLWLVAFAFGLVHGLGFAAVLKDHGLAEGARLLSLLGFNLGVEIGQLAIVMVLLPGIHGFRKWSFYPRVVLGLGSIVVLTVASLWFTERAFNLSILPG